LLGNGVGLVGDAFLLIWDRKLLANNLPEVFPSAFVYSDVHLRLIESSSELSLPRFNHLSPTERSQMSQPTMNSPPDANRGAQLLAALWVPFVFMAAALSARMFVRVRLKITGIDD
jgi:hypothetical protein